MIKVHNSISEIKNIKYFLVALGFFMSNWAIGQQTWNNNSYKFNNDQSDRKLHLDVNKNGNRQVDFTVGSQINRIQFNAPSLLLTGRLDFSTTTRQMINLWGNAYGIGIQNATQYFRTNTHFAWYKGGVHSDAILDPGSGGTAQMVLNNGYLGVGTISPSEKLDVNGNIRTDWLKVGDFGGYWGGIHSYGEKLYIGSETGQEVAFITHSGGGEVRMTLTPNGDLGVGTTNPSEKLDVNGNIYINNENSGLIVDAGNLKRVGFMKYRHREAGIWRAKNQDFEIGRVDQTSDISLGAGMNPVVDMYFRGDGKVGIGTNNPTEKLDVNGNTRAKGVILTGDGANTNTIDSNIDGTVVFGGEDGSTLTNSDIAASYYPDFAVWVEEGIVTEDIVIATTNQWADYVFENGYALTPLKGVEAFIKQHGHLEGIPSKTEVAEKGWSLADMDRKLLGKVEELTLYAIAQHKQIERLEEQINRYEALEKELALIKHAVEKYSHKQD
ncbi:hypothetical protein [Flaviramulus aquimarinus]